MVKALNTLPHPPAIPLLGNLHQVDLEKTHLQFEIWAKEYGPYFTVQLGPQKVLVISELEGILQALKDRPHDFQRTKKMQSIFSSMGILGVFTAEGEEWVKQRKLVMQSLNPQKIKNFLPHLRIVIERLKKLWMHEANKGDIFLPLPDLMSFTIDVTTQFAFGYDANTIENSQDSIRNHIEVIFPIINQRLRALIPYWEFIKLPKDRLLDKSLIALNEFTEKLIAGFNKKNKENIITEPANFLEALCLAAKDQSMSLNAQEVFANVLTMLLAGEDTTANVAAWATHLLALHPEVQNKIYEEVARELSGALPQNWQDLEKLKYTEGVALEALRMKSAAPVLFLQPTKDVVINDILVTKEVMIITTTREVGMQSQHFSEPEKFIPERWLVDNHEKAATANQKAFLPFGAGPRFCPGRNLSLVELKYLLVMWAIEFEISLPNNQTQPHEVFNFTMRPENLFIRLKKRN